VPPTKNSWIHAWAFNGTSPMKIILLNRVKYIWLLSPNAKNFHLDCCPYIWWTLSHHAGEFLWCRHLFVPCCSQQSIERQGWIFECIRHLLAERSSQTVQGIYQGSSREHLRKAFCAASCSLFSKSTTDCLKIPTVSNVAIGVRSLDIKKGVDHRSHSWY